MGFRTSASHRYRAVRRYADGFLKCSLNRNNLKVGQFVRRARVGNDKAGVDIA